MSLLCFCDSLVCFSLESKNRSCEVYTYRRRRHSHLSSDIRPLAARGARKPKRPRAGRGVRETRNFAQTAGKHTIVKYTLLPM